MVKAFFEVVRGLGEKLGPVLFQLPPTFKQDAKVLGEFLGTLPRGLRAAFEFRHESWFTDEIFGILTKHKVALCVAESEEFQTPRVATADFGYLRPRREDYKAAEIQKWAQFVDLQSKTWSEVFVYFKHEETCVGPGFARSMEKALAH